jgi:hypothetical protein
VLDAALHEALQPVAQRLARDGERRRAGLAGAMATAWRTRPSKERQNAAGRAQGVAVIEVVAAGIVEVDGELDQSQTQESAVEVQVALGVAGDGRDVMDTGNRALHVRAPNRQFAMIVEAIKGQREV